MTDYLGVVFATYAEDDPVTITGQIHFTNNDTKNPAPMEFNCKPYHGTVLIPLLCADQKRPLMHGAVSQKGILE